MVNWAGQNSKNWDCLAKIGRMVSLQIVERILTASISLALSAVSQQR